MKQKEDRFPKFKERFRKLQGERSNTEFADFLGMSRQTVGFYCNGARIPDALGIKEIAEKCNVSTDWLLGMSKMKSPKVDIRITNKTTGLSAEAINSLKRNSFFIESINLLLSSPKFEYILLNLSGLNGSVKSLLFELDGFGPRQKAAAQSGEIEENESLIDYDALDEEYRDFRYFRFEAIDAFTGFIDETVGEHELRKRVDQVFEEIFREGYETHAP